MSGLFGGKKASSQKSKAVSALQVQTSTFGQVLPLAYGKNRMAGNLGWYGNWIATAHTDQQSSGGKGGGGGSSTSTSYTYTTGVIILLCEGPITGIGTVWKDKELHTLSDLGFTLFTGTTPQTAWSWLQSYNSSQAIPYSGMAYVAASALQLGSSTGLPNLNYEVKGLRPYQAGTVDDALPSDILTDYLTDSVHGAGFGGYLGSTTALANYCLARGLFMSPIEDQQRTAADFVNDMATWCNFAPVWSYNVLNLLPYGDTAISSSYGSYTPNVTPIYALGADDFKYEQGNQSGVELDWKELEQCHNSVRVEYNDRSNSYNTVTQEAKDQADIDARGPYPMSSTQINGITSAQIARDVAQLMLQRDLYIRKTYRFRTDMRYMLLEPMDIVTLTDPNAGLTNELVRITKVTEQNDELDFEAEELPIGVASAPQYAPQNPGGYSQDFNVSPGSVSAPVIFNAPGMLTKDGFEMWIAVAGIGQFWGGCDVYVSEDNTTYQRVGRITAPARYGALTAALTAGSDPDTTNVAHVSLLRGQLNSGTQADADNWRQMAFVGGSAGGEVIAFETATLTGTLSYSLSYLRRGGYGSSSQAHVSGDVFARIDEAIFRLPYDKGKRGKTVYFKFTSFNVFGGAMEQLSAVTAYSHVVGASDVLAPVSLFDQLAGQYATPSSGSNFIPNPSFELNNISANGSVTAVGMPVCDSWSVLACPVGMAFTLDASTPEVGTNDLAIFLPSTLTIPANATIGAQAASPPIQVRGGQLLSFSGDIRTACSGGNPSSITWQFGVSMFFYNASGAMIGSSTAGTTAAANSANASYTKYSQNQITVPSGTSYARVIVALYAENSSSSAVTAVSWATYFDNLFGLFVTTADQINYTTGASVQSLQPAQPGADVTAQQTLVGIVNPQFLQGMTGWTPEADASNWSVQTGTNGPITGTQSYLVHNDSATTSYVRNAYKCPVSPGQVIKGQLICKGYNSPTGTAAVRLLWQDATGADISSSVGTTLVGNGIKTLTVTGVAPSNAAFCQINPGVGFASGNLGNYSFDNVEWNAQPASVDEVPDGTSYMRTTQQATIETIDNAGFDIGSSFPPVGWLNGSGGLGSSITSPYYDSTFQYAGYQSLVFTAAQFSGYMSVRKYQVNVGDTWVIGGAVNNVNGNASAAAIGLQFYNASGSLISTITATNPGGSGWTKISATGTVPSGAAYGQMVVYNNASGSVTVAFDALTLARVRNLATEVNGTLSTQKNLPSVTFSNYGSGWNGLTLSYSSTTTSATISASAATLQAGSDTISYNASSVTVSGTANTTVTYYLYYNDPSHAGGAQTLNATTNRITAISGNGYVYLASFSVTFPASGTGSGSGGGLCPLRRAWVIKRGNGGKRQSIRAGQVRVGDFLLLSNGAWGEVTYSEAALQPCVRVVVQGHGTLGCSASAPLKARDGAPRAADAKGRHVLILRNEPSHAVVTEVCDLGEQWVQHITCQNEFYWVGDSKDCLFAHHNMKPT